MMDKNRNRILYYCQSLVGIGHLTASIQIIQELLHYFDVDLIYGGISYSSIPQQEGFRVLELPTLLFNDTGELYHPQQAVTVDTIWQQRQFCIQNFINVPYKAIILEFYPFGRRRFKKEIRTLCRHIKQQSGEIPVFSQVREILVPSNQEDEENILHIINGEIHTVLVRGDPNVVTFDETFGLTSALGNRLFYGGYVSLPSPNHWPQRKQQILVSQGGGNVGIQLLTSAIETAILLPEYEFIIATGSTTSSQDITALQALVKSNNVTILPFLPNFRQHLLTSALSINMGGDNTLLDVIATKTPCLAFPYPGNTEQSLRIKKIAEHGWITPLSENDLNPQSLKNHIITTLSKPYPKNTVNLNGAVNICNKICDVIASYKSGLVKL